MRENILIVDDEEGIRATLGGILEDEGYRVQLAENATVGKDALERQSFDLAIFDIWLPDLDGLDLLAEVIETGFDRPVIMISGHGNIDMAVKAIRLGAYDFLEKPLSLSRVVLTVQNALERGQMARKLESLSARLEEEEETLIGESESMSELKKQLEVAALSDSRILITGENGTGKELVARQVHELSPRKSKPFVDVNCAAIPEELIESELFGHVRGAFTGATDNRVGRFQQADGGTLFLDEIGDMSLKTQAKVLRVLQEQRFEPVGSTVTQQVDVRVVAATNKDLEAEIQENRFREDLYFRLAVIPLHVPPLRERREDIAVLLQHFLDLFAAEVRRPSKRPSAPALERLYDYGWPGNVRELRNLAERLLIMSPGETIETSDLPVAIRGDTPTDRIRQLSSLDFESLKEARDHFEKWFVEQKLEQCEGNVSRTAEALGIERSNLYRKMKTLGIESPRTKE